MPWCRLSACFFWAALCLRADTCLVLPFANTSTSGSLDWIGESLADSLREDLAAEGLMVLDRADRVEAYRRLGVRPYTVLTRASVIKLGETLDADLVVYGQYDLTPTAGGGSKGTLRVTARILDLKRLRPGPEHEEAGPLEDLAQLQTRLSWRTLRAVAADAAPSEDEYRQRRPAAVRIEAIENYVRGLMAATPDQQLKLLSQSYKLDPRLVAASREMGRLHWRRKQYRQAAEWFQKVPPNDPQHREASFYLGLSRYHLGDYAGAQTALQTVAQAVPLNEVYNNLGAAQLRAGHPEALDNLRRALEGDPTDPVYHFNVGYALWRRGETAAAAERFRAALERAPEDRQARRLLDLCLAQSGALPGEPMERVKENYDESAYRQLKAVLERRK